MHFDVNSLSIKGMYHHDNQDFIRMDEKSGLFIVADGMGGAPAGALASKTAVSEFYSNLIRIHKEKRLNDINLNRALQASYQEIQRLFQKKKNRVGMGTTLSALVFNGDAAKILHIGDSVILRFRDSRLEQLTEEHTVANELIKQGYLKLEGSEEHPLSHVLSKCVGPFPDLQPDIISIDFCVNDIFILGSDGLFKLLTRDELTEVLKKLPDKSAKILVGQLKHLISPREFIDDCTFGLVKIVS
jgi:serine/threonine protein phosphatase PrpC